MKRKKPVALITEKNKGAEVPAVSASKEEVVIFDLRDIEFILKHLMQGSFTGAEVPQAYMTMAKLRGVHKTLVEKGVQIA